MRPRFGAIVAAVLIALSACDSPETAPPVTTEEAPPGGAPPGKDAGDVETRIERAIFELVNTERRERGIRELKWDDQLAELARGWSQQMAERGRLQHQDGQTMLERSDGFVVVGENIFRATGGAPASTIHVGWMRSDGHRANVLRDGFSRMGVGVLCTDDGQVWATQRFGNTERPKRPAGDVPPEQPIIAARGEGPRCPGAPAAGDVELGGTGPTRPVR